MTRPLGLLLGVELLLSSIVGSSAAAQPPPGVVVSQTKPPAAEAAPAAAPPAARSTGAPPPGQPQPEPGPPDPAAPVAAPEEAFLPGSGDADDVLAELGLDGTAATDDALNIYGFADVSYFLYLVPDDTAAASFIHKEHRFAVGNLNFYATRNLSDSWRMLAEVRFMYAPNGENKGETITTTATDDPADFDRPVNWGGIEIERVYVEHDIHPRVTIQAGSFLSPYGIWNVDHGSPAIIGVVRPYIVGEALIPERQTGLHAYGTRSLGAYTLGYHATLSNGRGPYEPFRDLDKNKALGGRLSLEAPWAGTLRVGASAYAGRFTDRQGDVPTLVDGKLVNTTPKGTSYDEVVYAADALWTHGRLQLQGEVITRSIAYRDGARGTAELGNGFAADAVNYGAYGLAAYRFDRFWNVTPFLIGEYYRPAANPYLTTLAAAVVGLNFRPLPSVALKAQLNEGWFPGASEILADLHIRSVMTQLSCAF